MDITTIKYPSHNDLVQWYYQLAQKIADGAGVTTEEVNALIAAYIEEHPYPVVPADVITASNAAQNVVTSVNGEKGDVTVPGVPANVITGDNIGQNAVTSFNGAVGAVTGLKSVNGKTGPDVSLASSSEGIIEVIIGTGLSMLIQNVPMTYGIGGSARYVGTLNKNGKTTIYTVVSAVFTEDPTPFTPNFVGFDTSEGVWTVFFGGLSSGTQPATGTVRHALVVAVVS